MNRRIVMLGLIATCAGACRPLPPGVRAPTEIWAIWSPDSRRLSTPDGFAATAETWIALDTISFRPTIIARLGDDQGTSTGQQSAGRSLPARRASVITSFQGSRYHADVIRGLGENSDAVAVTAGLLASLLSSSRAEAVILDFQEMAAEDLETLMDVSRAIADSSRVHSVAAITMMIPAADSAGYPARILGRIADLLLVKLFPEHGVTTPAGPIVSASWFTRRLGQRASEAGVNRVVAGIPTDGIIWDRRGARRISYVDAVRLAREASTPIVRDPASGNLHAVSGRDGWEIWLVDGELISRLIDEGRRIGVTRFALFGLEEADPALFDFVRGSRSVDR
jgi:hypothetical protein